MDFFDYEQGILHVEKLPVPELVRQYGTPLYIYSTATIRRHFTAYDKAFGDLPQKTCYSVKANGNIQLLKLLGTMGAGMDIVSGGELYRAQAAGIAGNNIVYSGVGKSEKEISQALAAKILLFNVESLQELEKINTLALDRGTVAPISFRLNPDVDPKTHPYISTGMKENKFGLDRETALNAYMQAKEMPGTDPVGIDCHIGSQLTEIAPFQEALDKLLAFYHTLCDRGLTISYLDLGGGLGIPYDTETPPHPVDFGAILSKRMQGLPVTVIVEPGRSIMGNAGILVTEVLYTKKTEAKNFIITDAGMNDLMRPSLYDAYHRIDAVVRTGRKAVTADVVGPICESGDFLARGRELPGMEPGELLACFSAGAYGFSMASNYNARPRPAEVLVDGSEAVCIRRRESYADLVMLEGEDR